MLDKFVPIKHKEDTMPGHDKDIEACTRLCLDCYRTCLQTASQHCLEAGGEHVEPGHFRLMLACAEICRTAAHTMLIGIEQHGRVCAACAEICRACAQSCAGVSDMAECEQACKRCAQACEKMG
ncbi:four-helix bundle copper-binding protein [Achromobacter xylosoxidans]|uniref:four-helix bundle copper-binding protein n=1 Tax=Alcaligenes xylosoxydans xylosoxydans TaxID=85698 RepID=UPI001CB77D34|nr:four-helix bundle copper-binding protein [Achromobacter xylosoxidans]